MAALYCLFALGMFALRGNAPFEKNDVTLLGALSAYLAGGLACGLAYGVLHPLADSLLGSLVIGIIAGNFVFGAMVVATSGLPWTWTRLDWEVVLVAGSVFGIVGTFMFRRPSRHV